LIIQPLMIQKRIRPMYMTGGNLLQNICRIQAKRWIANLLWWM
jgi:hypothetical protein